MADQDTPWKGLPPAPPGVPDQAPKPTGAPPTRRPSDDPWARPRGREPPSPRGSRPGSPLGGSPTIVKLVLGFAALMVLLTCVGLVPNALPDFDGGERVPAGPASGPGPDDMPTVARPFRVVRAGPAPGAPAGWSRYVAGDGSFSLIGPGRPDAELVRRGARYTFDAAPITLTAEVVSARGLGRAGRPRLERASAIFLDDLGAIEQGRRWTGAGDDVVLDIDARRGEDKFRIRTFVDGRRIFRAYALWTGVLAAEEQAMVETFLAGLASDGRAG